MSAASTLPDAGPLALRLGLDALAIALLAYGLAYRRHRRRDIVVLLAVFNVGLFAAVVVISAGQIAAAVGFGLFAVLSIIRLRGEALTGPELAYVFAAIVIGLVCAVDLGSPALNAGLAALVLLAPAVADHPGLLPGDRRIELTLGDLVADEDVLRARLERLLGGRVIEVEVLELDEVRELTRVRVRALPPTRGPAGPEEAGDGTLVTLAR